MEKRLIEAIRKIDRENENLVSLVDLVDKLGWTPEQVKRVVNFARIDGKVSVFASNGRDGGLTDQELATGWDEGGNFILYVGIN